MISDSSAVGARGTPNRGVELEVAAILEVLEGMHATEDRHPPEGLRERKKRRVRQRISNVATAMFLVHGFDDVTVAQIAAVSEVSEQTVFNYFTTKESMFFDRSGPMANAVADAVRHSGRTSLAQDVLESMASEIQLGRWEGLDEARQLDLSRRFVEVASRSPSLAAARFSDLGSFIDEVSTALAERVGASPVDPEVQLTTFVVAGLVRVRLQSTFHHLEHAESFAALHDLVHHDVRRAARLAEPSLAAFDELGDTKHDSDHH